MATTKSKKNQDLADRLHASGIRKKTAELMADAKDGGRKSAKQIRSAVKEMNSVLAVLEDRATGGPKKREEARKKAARSAAAKKGAVTRKANAAKRKAAAEKSAATRKANTTKDKATAKSSSKSTS